MTVWRIKSAPQLRDWLPISVGFRPSGLRQRIDGLPQAAYSVATCRAPAFFKACFSFSKSTPWRGLSGGAKEREAAGVPGCLFGG